MLVQVQVLALDGHLGFGGVAVLMQVQVQVLAVDWRFGFASAAAALMLVQVLALDRHFVLPVLVLVQGWRFVLPALAPCWCW